MAKIDIAKVARLARLHLTEEEMKYLETQVSQILSFVEKLNEVNGLENVTPTSHPLSLSNVFRADEIKSGVLIEEFLKHAPRARGRFFEVPKVIDPAHP